MAKWNDLFVVSAVPIMPKLIAPSSNVKIKSTNAVIDAANSATLFNEMATTRGSRFGAQAALLNNTSRQTIIDIVSGVSGTLTHVVGAEPLAADTVSIFVTAGGIETEYKFYNVPTGNRPVFGGALPIDPQLLASTVGASILGAADTGWQSAIVGLLTADEAVFNGIGIPFTGSLKVEIQYPLGVSVTGNNESAGVTYVRG